MNLVIPKAVQRKPIRYAMAYLWGTYGLFLIGGLQAKGVGVILLTLFVASAFSALYFGYWLGLGTRRFKVYDDSRAPKITRLNILCAIGGLYFLCFGVNMLVDFGIGSPAEMLQSILNPGAAYRAKFEVFADRMRYGDVNRVTQLLIVFSIFYAVLIPVLICHWKALNRWIRLFGGLSVGIYVVAFLVIGTMKGIGDVLLLSLAGVSVLLGSGKITLSSIQRRKILAATSVILIAGTLYMVANQASRASEFNKTGSIIVDDVSDTTLAHIVGEPWAYGIYALLAYPSHGYAGLSLDLQQEFVFARGAGLSPAFESYRRQYLGGDDNTWLTYPVRTEIATGWPADLVWSTAFPWFASDVTFPGTIALMVLIGFVFARVWINCIISRRPIALAALGQIFIFIAFLPANNQVLMQRQGLWILVWLISFWLLGIASRVRR